MVVTEKCCFSFTDLESCHMLCLAARTHRGENFDLFANECFDSVLVFNPTGQTGKKKYLKSEMRR